MVARASELRETPSERREHAALREAPVPGPRQDLPVIEDDHSTAERLTGRPGYLLSCPEVVVDVHERCLRREHVLARGIEDHDVRIGSRGEGALARIEAEDLRDRG